LSYFFFFQAEDGIRDFHVTGVQTCALPILLGTGTNAAIRDQEITVTETGTEHALRIVVARGPVILRVGSTSGGDDYITETTLGRSEEHTSELQSRENLVCRLLLEKKKKERV